MFTLLVTLATAAVRAADNESGKKLGSRSLIFNCHFFPVACRLETFAHFDMISISKHDTLTKDVSQVNLSNPLVLGSIYKMITFK